MDTGWVYLPDISAVSDIINEAQFNCKASLRVKNAMYKRSRLRINMNINKKESKLVCLNYLE